LLALSLRPCPCFGYIHARAKTSEGSPARPSSWREFFSSTGLMSTNQGVVPIECVLIPNLKILRSFAASGRKLADSTEQLATEGREFFEEDPCSREIGRAVPNEPVGIRGNRSTTWVGSRLNFPPTASHRAQPSSFPLHFRAIPLTDRLFWHKGSACDT